MEKEIWEQIRVNLVKLPARQQYVIEHRFLGDVMTYKQIAAELGISIQYASKLEKLALAKLRKFIGVY
jgi:RNA polymerase sigma factor (sigma-70 family)